MAEIVKKPSPGGRKSKSSDVSWLARLTHSLVFFGAALAVYEGTIGTALVVGKHSDQTVIFLCVLMAIVILVAIGTVALLVFRTPQHLMLVQQDQIGDEVRNVERIREATKIMLETPEPKTAKELLALMDTIEATLSRIEK